MVTIMGDISVVASLDFDDTSLDKSSRKGLIEEEKERLHDLVYDDHYWDLGSAECTRYRLATKSIEPTPSRTTVYRPKNSFQDLPSRHITEGADPSPMTEYISVDVSDYIFLEPRKLQYDCSRSAIICRTALDAVADRVVTEVIAFLAKLNGQSLPRYREFGLRLKSQEMNPLKGNKRLFEFACFQEGKPEYEVDLAFMPVSEERLAPMCEYSKEPVVLVVGLHEVGPPGKLIRPVFTVHDEITLTVDIDATVDNVVLSCLDLSAFLTKGRITRNSAHRVMFQFLNTFYAGSAQLRDLPIHSSDRDEGENLVKLVIARDEMDEFQPNPQRRYWLSRTTIIKVDISELALLLSNIEEEYPKPSLHPLILNSVCRVGHVTVLTSLLMTPNRLLQEVLEIARMTYGHPITANDEKTDLLLKGEEEELFLTEDHQLQHYDLVRNILAEDRELTLKLVERNLKVVEPAINFHYEGEAPSVQVQFEELRETAEECGNKDLSIIVLQLNNLQALFRNLDQVLLDYMRTQPYGKKVTPPKFVSPKIVYPSQPAPYVDLQNDNTFAANATALLQASGVHCTLKKAFRVVMRCFIGDQEVPVRENHASFTLANVVRVNQHHSLLHISMKNLPEETRICFELICGDLVIACVAFPLFEQVDEEHVQPRFGEFTLRLWPLHCICSDFVTMLEFSGIKERDREEPYATITISIPPCHWKREPKCEDIQCEPVPVTFQRRTVSMATLKTLSEVLELSPIEIEKLQSGPGALNELWDYYKLIDMKLPYFLKSVASTSASNREMAWKAVQEWAELSPEDAVSLLGCQFSDSRVRRYIVSLLDKMENNDLVNYIPQLAQALFFELRLNSPLEQFLLRRALQDPYEIGHQLYWCLRSQYMILPYRERLMLLIERFVMRCGNYRKVLATELKAVTCIKQLVQPFAGLKMSEAQMRQEEQRLEEALMAELPDKFTMPTSTTRILQKEGIKCKIKDSKMKPVHISFQIAGCPGKTYQTMIKIGDDLRQDMLIVQIFRVLQKTWRDDGLPVRMKTYRVVAIDQVSGLIEIVPNSTQISKIQLDLSGLVTRKSVWIHSYISRYNADFKSLKKARENFMISCACYCAATYVLGIGDRHDGNIMISHDGVLFHIDFGHILGHFKKKWHIRRERYKVKFSEDMATVLSDSNNYLDFLELSQRLYNSLRKKGHRLYYLMKMMSTGGLPELKKYDDLEYLVKRLKTEKSDGQVKDLMKRQVEKSLKSWLRPIDRFFHNVAHSSMRGSCSCFSGSES